jgi:hypothetical protein
MRKVMRYIGIIILLVLCLTLLLLTGCTVNTDIPETATKKPETVNPQKWSGLTGFTGWYDYVGSYGDIWLANGFTEIRDLRDYQDTTNVNGSKAAVLAANAKGLKFIWGVTSSPTIITAANWADFRQAILDAAQWAQDNGVFEFQLGNEEELHNDDTTLTNTQLVINLKAVATEVKAIFTNGNVSYSMSWDDNAWLTAGKGDIDIVGLNVSRGSDVGTFDDDWKTKISNALNVFGVDGLYITEFNLSSINIENYSTDEAVQATAVTEMIEYIKASGIKRALFYTWKDHPGGLFGVVKDDGTYRLLWSQALLNSGSVKSTTVPTKTTTISLPDTITLIPK